MARHKDRREHGAAVALRLGAGPAVAIEVTATSAALWAVAGLVGIALLGSAAIVQAAGQKRRD